MQVLGIETSCDETAAAVVGIESRIISNIIHTQTAAHAPFGGVVPEVASREHVRRLVGIIEAAVAPAGGFEAIDGIAVTQGPGLSGALLVGLQMAKGLALARRLPFIGVNHLEGHLFAARLDPDFIDKPHIAVIVSGGHTQLFACENFDHAELLGGTRDDAAGEAFDKIAKLLGLGYPGGPAVEQCGRLGDPTRFAAPRALKDVPYAMSFSGLKTWAAQWVRRQPAPIDKTTKRDFCASIEAAIAETIVDKAVEAALRLGLGGVVLGGGVAANTCLRETLVRTCQSRGLWSFAPPKKLCTDNAAMIAGAGRVRLLRGERSDWTSSARPRWPLAEVKHAIHKGNM